MFLHASIIISFNTSGIGLIVKTLPLEMSM